MIGLALQNTTPSKGFQDGGCENINQIASGKLF